MIVSSGANSIFFKKLIAIPVTAGNYPDRDNTLHEDYKDGNHKIIPYCQKFPKDHVVYLQFESDSAVDIILKAYSAISARSTLTEIESFTGSYVSVYGSTNVRYYYNFTVTLDSVYYDKIVYFKATQGAEVWTSEPILTKDLAWLFSHHCKYIKYSNIDKIESDIPGHFIDWSVVPSTGNYMDFFVEMSDRESNNKDESEVLEGSQSLKILSAVSYNGRVFKTGPVPDYMAIKLRLASSLDYFLIGDKQYTKQGEVNQDPFGGSTSDQCTLKAIQKNAIGINVDNLGVTADVITPPIAGTPMYIGSVTSAAPDETEVKLIADIAALKQDHTVSFTGTDIRPCHAAPTSFGVLASILDATGDEIISGFAVTTLDFTIGADTISFKIYTLKSAVTLSGSNITFKF